MDSSCRSWGITCKMAWRATVVLPALIATAAFAGPPLVCHPLTIGNEKSLPSGNGPFGYDPSYDRSRVVKHTLELLTPEMPVVVRMETLRRATLYASQNLRDGRWGGGYSDEDRRLAFELVSRLMDRALRAESAGKPDALAWFDTGYLLECLRQAGLVRDFDGYAMVKKAAELRGNDPGIEFASALITLDRARNAHAGHVRKARAGMRPGTLLAVNFARRFGKSGTF